MEYQLISFLMSMITTFMFVFLFSILPLVGLYYLADKPNKFVSGMFSFKIWGIALVMIVVPAGILLSEVLKAIGFAEFSFGFDLDAVRGSLIALVIGFAIIWAYKKFFGKSVLSKTDEPKKPELFASQIFHTYAIGTLAALSVFIIVLILDFILQYVLSSVGHTQTIGEVFSTVVALLIPTVILGVISYPSIMKGQRLLPEAKSSAYSVFVTTVVATSMFAFLGTLGGAVYAIMTQGGSLDITRSLIVGLVVSGLLFGGFVWKHGGKKIFMK